MIKYIHKSKASSLIPWAFIKITFPVFLFFFIIIKPCLGQCDLNEITIFNLDCSKFDATSVILKTPSFEKNGTTNIATFIKRKNGINKIEKYNVVKYERKIIPCLYDDKSEYSLYFLEDKLKNIKIS